MTELDLIIGAKVRCRDGECGKLIKVVLDPQAKKISEIIVEKGFLLSKDRVIPVEEIKRTTQDEVYLDIESDQLEEFAEYDQEDFITPEPDRYGWEASTTYDEGEVVTPATPYQPRPIFQEPSTSTVRYRTHEGVSPTEEVIEPGTRVYNPEGTVGKIDQIKVDPDSRKVTQIIVDRGLLSGNTIIPISKIEKVNEDGIYITASNEEIDSMKLDSENE